MTLLASFTHPVADAQQVFRRLLKAMSEPGVVVTLPDIQGWGDLSPAATAVLLTLVDQETALWLEPTMNSEIIRSNLRFHTGVSIVSEQDAPFALSRISANPDPLQFSAGDNLSPEKSTTLIVEVDGLSGGTALRLSGPGLREPRVVSPYLSPAILTYVQERPHPFPQGIDLILTCGDRVMALPRTTHVEVC